MPLPMPNLDDRDFEQLVEEATRLIRQHSPDWDDLSPSDPGVVLLEAFAYLTDIMIYRLNRLPEKAYIAFLRLLGVERQPPAAAAVTLRFERARSGDSALEIPRGTRVTAGRTGQETEPPIFTTASAATIPAGEQVIEVRAYHAENIDAEKVGEGTGLPGQTFRVAHPPIIDETGDDLDLIVAVEAGPTDTGVRAREYGGKTFHIWQEVDTFTNLGEERRVYVVDRMTGTIHFAPALKERGEDGQWAVDAAALAEVPAAGREIRVWYRRGGGPAGNVMAGTLTVLKDPVPGVNVTNPEPATGGLAAETLANARLRGPKELHSLQRAVTASDFELLAIKTKEVARAKAYTKRATWQYAAPGTVEVLLVPHVPEKERPGGKLPAQTLRNRQIEAAREQVQRVLDERRPLGTHCEVKWARYKPVRIGATFVIRREEDADAVKGRIVERLYRTISPLSSEGVSAQGWPFGGTLRASNVYDIALAEPGVRWVEDVRLYVDEVPGAVTAIAADHFQARTWYAASGNGLFRTLNDGTGWEPSGTFPEAAEIERIATHPRTPGLVALSALVRGSNGDRSIIYVSQDCGDTWAQVANTSFHVEDLAWTILNGSPVLLLASDAGLFRVTQLDRSGTIAHILVDQNDQTLAFYAVAAATDAQGNTTVAVAAQGDGGIWASYGQAGMSTKFRRLLDPNIDIGRQDVRNLAIQQEGSRAWLWAGTALIGEGTGDGCFRWELRGDEDPVAGWEHYGSNVSWRGGSCWGLAFMGSHVYAATHRGGVMRLNTARANARWEVPDVNSGLPVRDLERGRFARVDAIAANPKGSIVMAGIASDTAADGKKGVYYAHRVKQDAEYANWRYTHCTTGVFEDKVTIPDGWLLTAGEHAVTVKSEDEASDEMESA